jgi:hypothetical protein
MPMAQNPQRLPQSGQMSADYNMNSLCSGIDLQLCSVFYVSDWIELAPELDNNNETSWDTAIGVFEKRIKERFLSCIDALNDLEAKKGPNGPCVPGFAIMGLCCLLMETLQAFQEELDRSTPRTLQRSRDTKKMFMKILKWDCFNGAFKEPAIANSFREGIRNGILHNAETRNWIIRRNAPEGQLLEKRGQVYVLNRAFFLEAVKREFENYLCRLRTVSDPENQVLRRKFIENMNLLCTYS